MTGGPRYAARKPRASQAIGVAEPSQSVIEDNVIVNFVPEHVGGGYYELSDGSKVKGKEAAQEAQADL